MTCANCGQQAYSTLTRWDDKTGEKFETCDRCGDCGQYGMPDVYFREPYKDEHLVDEADSSTWNEGTAIRSKRHKAEVMKKLNLKEAGDRIHGARLETKRRTYFT